MNFEVTINTHHWARVNGEIVQVDVNTQFDSTVICKHLNGAVAEYPASMLENVLDNELDKAGVSYRRQQEIFRAET